MNLMKKWWSKHWKVLMLLFFLALGSIILVSHNQSMYRRPIGKVIAVKVIHRQKQKDEFNNIDYQYKQRLTLRVMNGKHQGKPVYANNDYSQSGGMDQRYQIGQQAFLTQLSSSNGHLTANVSGLKRDTTLVALLWIVVILVTMLFGRSGGLAFTSVILNVVFFVIAVKINVQTQANYLLLIFAVVSVLMALASLTFVYGWSKQTLATLIASLLGVGLSMLIFVVVSKITGEKGIYYESMQYVTQNYRMLYLAEVMIGVLGAVMDETSDILATMFEVKRINHNPQWRTLYDAGRSVGQSVMGPLANILLMIFLFSTLTNAVLLLRNGNSWGYTFNMCMSLGVAQSLVSGIGIVITVPVISYLAAFILARR